VTKYHAKPTTVDGIRFASKAEARRYQELKMLEKAGRIRNLKLQPKYPLVFYPGSSRRVVNVGSYIADFWYLEVDGGVERPVLEDVKGVKTPIYRLKKKMVEAIYDLKITEVA
jgi:hypothetical protein